MEHICAYFPLDGRVVSGEPIQSGHINHTFHITTDRGHEYILQSINGGIFKDIPGLMRNIQLVTEYLQPKHPDPRCGLTLVLTSAGEPYVTVDGVAWRVYEFITDSVCLSAAETAEDLRQSGVAFGAFQNQLADFPAETLTETIPHFHDTPDRYRQFREAIAADKAGRLTSVQAEVDWFLRHEGEADVLMSLCRSGELPLRVTHNDTKLTNVMLDAKTRAPLCVIDLDTVMPGLVASDFGDAIRFGASTAAEDEKDLRKVSMSLEMYEAFAGGFLSACGGRLTAKEIDTLPWGAKMMTLECGMRFLTDYLNGDVYFGIHYPEQNLDRARTQMTLLDDMERKWDEMNAVIARLRP